MNLDNAIKYRRIWVVYIAVPAMVIISSVSCVELPILDPVPSREVISSTLPAKVLWQVELERPVDHPPLILDSAVIGVTSRSIYSLDKSTGQQQWKHSFTHWSNPISIASANGRIVYGHKKGQVTALDTDTGQVVWQRFLGDRDDGYFRVNNLLVDDKVVYVVSQPTAIEAIDLETGEPNWIVVGSETNITSRGAVIYLQNDKLYVATDEVHILNSATGEIIKQYEQSIKVSQLANNAFYGRAWVREAKDLTLIARLHSPSEMVLGDSCHAFVLPYAFEADYFFAVGRCGGVFKLSQKTHKIQWEYRTQIVGESPLTIYQDTLYAMFDDGEIHAIDPITGKNKGILKTSSGSVGAYTDKIGLVSDDTILLEFCDGRLPQGVKLK